MPRKNKASKASSRRIRTADGQFESYQYHIGREFQDEPDLQGDELQGREASELLDLQQDPVDTDEDPFGVVVDSSLLTAAWSELMSWNPTAQTGVIKLKSLQKRTQREATRKRELEQVAKDQKNSIRKYFNNDDIAVEQPLEHDEELEDFGIAGFFPGPEIAPTPVMETDDLMAAAVMDLLSNPAVKLHNNQKLEKKAKGVSFFARLQLLAVCKYFQVRLQGVLSVAASVQVATAIFSKDSKNSYKSRGIRTAQQSLGRCRVAR